MYILAQVCVWEPEVGIKILFAITLHLSLLGLLLKNYDENVVTSFTPFPAFFTLPLTRPYLTLSNWWLLFGPLDSSVTCTHVPIHTQMKSLQVHRSQERTQFLHCVHKHRGHWSLCGKPQDTPSNPPHSKYFQTSPKQKECYNASQWAVVNFNNHQHCGNPIPLPPSSESLLTLETGTQAWAHDHHVLIPRSCFFESLSPWM